MKTRLGYDYVVEMARPSPDPTDDEAPHTVDDSGVYEDISFKITEDGYEAIIAGELKRRTK